MFCWSYLFCVWVIIIKGVDGFMWQCIGLWKFQAVQDIHCLLGEWVWTSGWAIGCTHQKNPAFQFTPQNFEWYQESGQLAVQISQNWWLVEDLAPPPPNFFLNGPQNFNAVTATVVDVSEVVRIPSCKHKYGTSNAF